MDIVDDESVAMTRVPFCFIVVYCVVCIRVSKIDRCTVILVKRTIVLLIESIASLYGACQRCT